MNDTKPDDENQKIKALEQFKAYVHKRLDDAGVPVDPDSPHKAEGCRIGGRLDVVFAGRDALLAACQMVADFLDLSSISTEEYRAKYNLNLGSARPQTLEIVRAAIANAEGK